MKRRLIILTEIIAPYRIPVFNALAARPDIDLHVIFLSENDPSLRQWHVYKDEIRFSCEVLPSWRSRLGKYNVLINGSVGSALSRSRPEAILCGGYSYLASWQAAWWAKRHSVPLLLWSESTAQDRRSRHLPVELLKSRFRRFCRAFVAAGTTSHDYLLELGAPEGSIFIAPDAVDVNLYAESADRARRNTMNLRAEHGLPQRYFLYVGRLVEEKGIFDLLAAYARLDERVRGQIGLVFVGDGAARAELARRASQIHPGTIKLCGWVHRERLPEFYALAEVLIFPTHSDPWGLVVNEAMACSLPIIASTVAGCALDLVESGANGFLVPPRDPVQLARAMKQLFDDRDLAVQMSARSVQRVQGFTPQAWAEGLAKAVDFACNRNT